MDVEDLHARLAAAIELVAADDRPAFVRGWIANLPKNEQTAVVALMGILSFNSQLPTKHIVVLLHGIRTAGVWQDAVKRMFEGTNVTVVPLGYGYFDALRFAIPWGRSGAISLVSRELQALKRDYPSSDISVIAHSFGTYIITKVLAPDQGIRLKRLLLCGSIVPTDFAWENVKGKPPRDSIVNDVGTRDIWPVLARTLTWGYGTSGTYGFKQTAVTDRYHDLAHSDFFSELWVRKFWLPFISDGTIHPSDWEKVRPTPPTYLALLGVIQLKYIVMLLLASGGWWLWR
ncbi:hypothetical protein [Variovorax paradoxus]|uniref:Alpha/beta hydrolase n=1 Tax=Variovorax paradoxus TaxID=34073 RepID=A0A679JDK4_VARPD|nr:hypothetical protein VVAX_04706 [Variovorax paradoxus]